MTKLVFVTMLLTVSTVAAQTTEMPPPPVPAPTTDPALSYEAPPEPKQKKEPERGDFDAGGQARFPSGPDEMGQFDSFNWVAVDLKARYYLLKTVTANANIPLAVKKPDTINMGATDPSLIGGFTLNLDARLPLEKGSLPFMKYDTDIGLVATLGYMREGAMLLSEKDYPLFTGSMRPGTALGLVTKLKMSSVLDFSLVPTWVYQSGEMESLTAIQVPMALGIALGSLLKVNYELGIFTGDDYSLRGRNGGRIATGGSLDVKIGPILVHAGAGVASLLSGGLYPSISESFYVDLNVKYVK